MLRKFFRWIFKDELKNLKTQIDKSKTALDYLEVSHKKIKNLLGNYDVSVDLHQYSSSWACISIQGEKTDFIKFIDLGRKDIREIQLFLRNFDRSKIDAHPGTTLYLRCDR